MVEKIATRAGVLIPRALSGDLVAITLLAMAGFAVIARSAKDNL